MVKQLALRFGYAESQSLAWLIMTSTATFRNTCEALTNLGQVLASYCAMRDAPKGCCVLEKEKGVKFCGQCGTFLINVGCPVEEEDIRQVLRDLLTGEIDGNNDLLEYLDAAGWSTDCEEIDCPRIIGHSAWEIIAALATGNEVPDWMKDQLV